MVKRKPVVLVFKSRKSLNKALYIDIEQADRVLLVENGGTTVIKDRHGPQVGLNG